MTEKSNVLQPRYHANRRKVDPEYDERRRAQARASAKRRRQKIRGIIHEALTAPCVDCGIQLPPQIMDFDHVRGEKLFHICHAINSKSGYVGYDKLHAEIAKCDIRCPNCHRLRHYEEGYYGQATG